MTRLARLGSELGLRNLATQTRTVDLSNIQRTIEDVKSYAKLMGMPRIYVEAMSMDSQIRLTLGDLHHAHASITEALALASENGMELRRTTLLLQLARVYLKRGLIDDACLLADSIRRMSLAADYSVVMDAAQEILVANTEAAHRVALMA